MKHSKEYMKMAAEFDSTVLPGTGKSVTVGAGNAPKLDLTVLPPARPKKVRHVFIEARFPELKGGQMYQTAHGEAVGNKAAISRAFKNLLKTIPKKRISAIVATISITTKIVEG